MSTLTNIRDHLVAGLAPLTVATTDPGTTLMASKANAAALFTELKQVFDHVSPLHADQDAPFPEAIYRLSGIGSTEWGGIETSHVSSFDVSARALTYIELCELVDALDASLKNKAGFDIVDSAEAYDDLRKAYRADLAIDICRPIADVIVIEISKDLQDVTFMGKNCSTQDFQSIYAVIHHDDDLSGLSELKASTESLLKNYQPDGSYSMQLQSGEVLPAAAGLCAWVNTYTLQSIA